jgi:hypothetical protein
VAVSKEKKLQHDNENANPEITVSFSVCFSCSSLGKMLCVERIELNLNSEAIIDKGRGPKLSLITVLESKYFS